MKDYPIGTTQKKVLEAMGLTATGHRDATGMFAKMGLVVSSRREGRGTVPVVTVLNRQSGGFSEDGEGVIFTKYPDIPADKLAAIAQWIVK